MSAPLSARPTCPTCKKRMSERQYAGHVCLEVVRRAVGEALKPFEAYCERVKEQRAQREQHPKMRCIQ